MGVHLGGVSLMPDWQRLFGDTTLVQAVLWIVAAGLLVVVIVKLWPFIRNAVAIVDALVQLPSFIARTDKTLQAHTKQIENSHSTNMRDDITAAVTAAEGARELVEGLHGRMDDVDRQLTTLSREDEALWAELENTQAPEEET